MITITLDIERARFILSGIALGCILTVVAPSLNVSVEWTNSDVAQGKVLMFGILVGALVVYVITQVFGLEAETDRSAGKGRSPGGLLSHVGQTEDTPASLAEVSKTLLGLVERLELRTDAAKDRDEEPQENRRPILIRPWSPPPPIPPPVPIPVPVQAPPQMVHVRPPSVQSRTRSSPSPQRRPRYPRSWDDSPRMPRVPTPPSPPSPQAVTVHAARLRSPSPEGIRYPPPPEVVPAGEDPGVSSRMAQRGQQIFMSTAGDLPFGKEDASET
ncbi:hypothetical protein SISNIDRAFT_456345 [Sistotremastrum niveocremeum HHB9708]|uniref:Uncharacterized protein n=2 Tax=Sistotremastraceae TaxID=3402574 RepID=A0A164SSK9_9AGAM|nr:hypothetical protein SISNIDRAFT_456345 [Sistotremastrum niveocremeum HHB9708]KZT33089.1 hypothetical protein SISSUDRAFT_1054645 [Sistotremastrum suecicum HHB10207 ss-3]